MPQNRILGVFLIILLLILVGCNNKQATPSSTYPLTLANGDILDKTNGSMELPSFLSNKPEEISKIYTSVAKYKQLLEKIPCYCGCGESADHKNNYDCFINQNNQDGSIVWDDHGTKCNVCLETATKSISEYQNGKTPMEIRQEIDHMYMEGYAKPTPTPMPKENR